MLIPCCHWKTVVSFCLPKKRRENAFLTLIVNYRKLMPSKKTRNWTFNDKCCYLRIAYFDWNIGVFQQTVASIYYNVL